MRISKVKTTIEKVTPRIAKQWLSPEINRKNRKISQLVVLRYQNAMRFGTWKFTGDPIQFAADGTLLNGQHRLTALVGIKIPQYFVIVRGISEDAQAVMDNPKRRSFADAMQIDNVPNYTKVAAICRAWLTYMNLTNTATEDLKLVNGSPTIMQQSILFSTFENEIVSAAKVLTHTDSKRIARYLCSGGNAGVLWIMSNRCNRKAAIDFWEIIGKGTCNGASGRNVGERSAPMELRNDLLDAFAKRRPGNFTPTKVLFARTIKAWNFFLDDVPVTKGKFYWPITEGEPFPKFRQ